MNGFYIKRITVTGSGVPDSVIELKDGVNIISGPSDTGKTYVIRCIDYLFGADLLPIADGLAYDTIKLTIVCRVGDSFNISRKIGEKKVTITESSVSTAKDGEYKLSSEAFRKLYLSLIGISDAVKLVKKQDYTKTQELTWRTLEPMFFIHEEHIFRSDSIVTSPRFNNVTAALSALKYLYDGKQTVIPEMGDKIGAETSKKAVLAYISGRLQALKDEKKDLETTISNFGETDTDELLSQQSAKLEAVVREMESLGSESAKILQKKIALDDALKELQYLQERYSALASGYRADIKRLQFIIDAEEKHPKDTQNAKCPFCSSAIQPKQHRSLAAAAGNEEINIQKQLSELEVLIKDNEVSIKKLEEELSELEVQHYTLQERIISECQPHLSELRESIRNLEKLQQMKARLAYIKELAEGMDLDMKGIETGEELPLSYDAKTELGHQFYDLLDSYISDMLTRCKYDAFLTAHLNQADFDIIVDGKKKKNHGKGYRAFLNTVLAYCLLKLLSTNGVYSPGLLILDSPVLSLKEKDEQTSSVMKEALFKCLIQTDFPCQIIIAENDIPDIDYGDTNLINFTKDHSNGRYGFLRGV